MKQKIAFVCSACGSAQSKWLGKCPDCSAWNSLVEESIGKSAFATPSDKKASVVPLTQVTHKEEERHSCSISEFDRVLGGGLVVGSVVLISGDPGIGKSTLLLQALNGFAKKEKNVLYASGEESAAQIKLRADRLGITHQNIYITNETDVLGIIEAAKKTMPQVLVIDSIQTVLHPLFGNTPGTVTQIRECTNALVQFAKSEHISTIVVGHVTKEGNVAGPKLLEHLVDTVLHLEGDLTSGYRILRAHKNRFGSTGEIGVFAMHGNGLCDVPNPSALFLDEHSINGEGCAVAVCMEGTRPLLIEVQVLVGKTSFSTPRRLATGFDTNRFTILLAVLEKRAGLYLSNVDVYANVTGGFKISEPAADLATAAAVASSVFGRPMSKKYAFFGEVGLSGEVRMINHALNRIQEAQKLGFERVYLPARNYQLEKEMIVKIIEKSDHPLHVIPVETVSDIARIE